MDESLNERLPGFPNFRNSLKREFVSLPFKNTSQMEDTIDWGLRK